MRRILFVTPVDPFSNRSGSEQRSSLMLAALMELGLVDILILVEVAQKKEPEVVEVNGIRVLKYYLCPSKLILSRYRKKSQFTTYVEELLPSKLMDYDLIVGRYAWGISQLDIPDRPKTIVDLDDYRYRFDASGMPNFKIWKEAGRKTIGHLLMRASIKRFDAAFVASERDLKEVKAFTKLKVMELPNVAPRFDGTLPGSKCDTLRVLFVGSLWYGPNVDGIEWFLHKVWPLVLTQTPAAQLQLIGAAPELVRKRWECHRNVSAPGFVESLANSYAQSSVVVVPIHSGGGTNIKVLEALSMGRPCVVSDFVADAFFPRLLPGVHFRSASTPREFANQILATLNSVDEADDKCKIAAGRTAINEHFNANAFVDKVINFAGEVITAGGGRKNRW